MTGPKLTRWLASNTHPLRNRPGEYEASHTMKAGVRRWWDGQRWSKPYMAEAPENVKAEQRAYPATFQNVPWRGLADPPEDEQRAEPTQFPFGPENPQEGPPAA